MSYGRIALGVILALLLVGLVAGVGLTAYNAGIARGMVESGQLVLPPGANGTPSVPYYAPFGLYSPFGFYRPFGFGLLGCFIPLFFILLLFLLFRLAFRPRWGGHWMRGGWDPSPGDVPERLKEFHRKLHEAETSVPPSTKAES